MRLSKILTAVAVAVALCAALGACGGGGNKGHTHTYGDWTVSKQANCTQAGSKSRVCSDCGETETESIAAKGHTEEIVAGVSGGCTADGLTEGKRCSVCDTVLVEQVRTVAAGHQMSGETCGVCGKGYSKDLKFRKGSSGYTCTGYDPALFENEAPETDVIVPDEYLGERVVAIESAAFKYGAIKAITLGRNIGSIGLGAFESSALAYAKLPDTLTSISENAFKGCLDMTKFVIPASVTTIGDRAFAESGLLSVSIPDNVKTLGKSVFSNCSYLVEVKIGNGLTVIPTETFLYSGAIERVVIGEGTATIKDGAFAYIGALKDLVIGKNVKTIETEAFLFSTAKFVDWDDESGDRNPAIEHVWYAGSAAEWAQITVGADNAELTDATVYYYSETQPAGSSNAWRYVGGVPTAW